MGECVFCVLDDMVLREMGKWYLLLKEMEEHESQVRGLFTCYADARHSLNDIVKAEGPGAWRVVGVNPNECIGAEEAKRREQAKEADGWVWRLAKMGCERE
jgi:hypothetical protein